MTAISGDVLKMAREAVAKEWEKANLPPHWIADVRSGQKDNTAAIRVSAIAIMMDRDYAWIRRPKQ